VLGSFILGSNKGLIDMLSWTCLSCQGVTVHKALYELPALHHLVRLLNAYSPEVVFLEIDHPEEALPLACDIQVVLPNTALIGFSEKVTRETLQGAAAYGVGEILQAPFDQQAVIEAMARAIENRQHADDSELVLFQPARGGSGTTTAALHVARSLAEDWRQKVLLLEADLYSGPLALLLDLKDVSSIADALEQCEALSDSSWKRFVSTVRGVDVLPAPQKRRPVQATPWSCQRLLSFAAARYDIIIVDLPEIVFEPFSPVFSRATQAYVVCNPDTVSLAMAQRRLKDLEEAKVNPAVTDVIVNRFPDGPMKLRDIEKALSRPLSVELPSAVVKGQSTLRAGLADARSPLARACEAFAKAVAGEERTAALEPAGSGLRGFARLLKQSLAATAPAKSESAQ
jgi:MinD-like ATPase involved in chromosome partitioning or flagellar assembly